MLNSAAECADRARILVPLCPHPWYFTQFHPCSHETSLSLNTVRYFKVHRVVLLEPEGRVKTKKNEGFPRPGCDFVAPGYKGQTGLRLLVNQFKFSSFRLKSDSDAPTDHLKFARQPVKMVKSRGHGKIHWVCEITIEFLVSPIAM
jgi:hypothetical protein